MHRCHEEIVRLNEELDRRRREAEDASGRKTRLLASVSHDIRSPLNSISLMAQLIHSTAADPGLAQRHQVHPDGGVMATACLTPERAVLIRVRDTGVGMAPEGLDRIFGEFAQLHDSDRASAHGWGLGLSICRRLAELMGGRITVESQPNRGSVFTVRLPASCVRTGSEADPDGVGRVPNGQAGRTVGCG